MVATKITNDIDHSVGARIYKKAKESYEAYEDPVLRFYVVNKEEIPENQCDTAFTVWTSDQVTYNKAIEK